MHLSRNPIEIDFRETKLRETSARLHWRELTVTDCPQNAEDLAAVRRPLQINSAELDARGVTGLCTVAESRDERLGRIEIEAAIRQKWASAGLHLYEELRLFEKTHLGTRDAEQLRDRTPVDEPGARLRALQDAFTWTDEVHMAEAARVSSSAKSLENMRLPQSLRTNREKASSFCE